VPQRILTEAAAQHADGRDLRLPRSLGVVGRVADRDRIDARDGVRSLDHGRDRSLRLSVREGLTGPGADFMSTSPMGANKPIEDIDATLLAATKSALDQLVWWAHATMAAKA
jgi:hypothetical protein